VAWGAKKKLEIINYIEKKGSRIIVTFGLDWNGALKAIEFNIEELKGCTYIGIVASLSKESQRYVNAGW
jgi:hypothetical protein